MAKQLAAGPGDSGRFSAALKGRIFRLLAEKPQSPGRGLPIQLNVIRRAGEKANETCRQPLLTYPGGKAIVRPGQPAQPDDCRLGPVSKATLASATSRRAALLVT